MFKSTIAPKDVIASLNRHILADGFDIVVDLEKTQGSWLVDARDGRRYVDFFTYIASVPVGFNHPKLLQDDVIRKLGRIAVNKPTNSDVYSTHMAEFVDTFHRLAVPPYMRYSFYTEGGAVAVGNALKAAFDWKVQKNFARGFTPEKGYKDGRGHKIIHFHHCFHGRTGYCLSLTDSPDPNKTKWFPKFDWPRISSPAATFPLVGANLDRTIELEKQAVREIEDAVAQNPHDIAGLIIEPIQGEGGDNHFRPEFHRELRRLANEHEFLLIYDEVQTGLGLTGQMWGHQNYGIEPDIISFGKKTQVCGILAGKRLEENEHHVFNTSSRINSTWGGNLIDMVRCQLFLEIIEEENLLQNVRTQGERLISTLHALEREMDGAVSNVRGSGLFCAFDLSPKVDRACFLREAMKQGVIVLPCGTHSVRFRPALNIDAETLDEGMQRVRTALRSVYQPSNGTNVGAGQWQGE
jgi:L-lysine 6-transaminase